MKERERERPPGFLERSSPGLRERKNDGQVPRESGEGGWDCWDWGPESRRFLVRSKRKMMDFVGFVLNVFMH